MKIRSIVLAAGLTACAPVGGQTTVQTKAVAEEKAPETNVLLEAWVGPQGGVPPFDKVKVGQFKPAMLAAMELQRKEIAQLCANPALPTFENTIAALEASGRDYTRVSTVFGVWSSSMNDDAFAAVERELAPVQAAFADELTQNTALFSRIEAVYKNESAKLTPEQKRLTWLLYTGFVRAGAKLDQAQKKRIGEINQRLASLYTDFSQAVLSDEENVALLIENEADLAGLPDSFKASAAEAAAAKGQKGKWRITNTRSAMEPFLTFSTRRDLREKVWTNYVNRGDNKDKNDNNARITEILKLRAERAKLLGYPTHAHWRLEDAMAKTPARAMELMEAVWKPAVKRVGEEVKDMQTIADRELGAGKVKIAPWDYRFYAEKVRKAKYDLDENEIKPYLQLEKLRDALFFVAGELFDYSFTPLTGVPVYHPDVSVYEVKDRTSGKVVGLWYFDPYARPGKQSGAWMNAFRNQERMTGEVTTIVSNNANFMKGKPGEAVLISWDDANTLFHEFGHALHGLASNVTYPTVSGTNVARDYVEFPSQLLEHWLDTKEVLSRYALHAQTGQPIPDALVAKIKKAATFNSGFSTVEYLASALIDMKLHLAGDAAIDPDAFERDTLKQLGMPTEIVMRHRTPQFGHVFSGDGYSAGYYSYLWSDTLTADAFEAFAEGKGAYDKAVAAKLRQFVFSVGNTVDPADGYKAFRGREAGINALMRKRGFPEPSKR
jgi:peptidyl-dipeptidase Dcp